MLSRRSFFAFVPAVMLPKLNINKQEVKKPAEAFREIYEALTKSGFVEPEDDRLKLMANQAGFEYLKHKLLTTPDHMTYIAITDDNKIIIQMYGIKDGVIQKKGFQKFDSVDAAIETLYGEVLQ